MVLATPDSEHTLASEGNDPRRYDRRNR